MEPSAGSFTCSWSNVSNYIAKMGVNYDDEKQNYKSISKDLILSYNAEFTPKGNAYMGVYGWTRNPLAEYYIIEGWGDWRPPGGLAENMTFLSQLMIFVVRRPISFTIPR